MTVNEVWTCKTTGNRYRIDAINGDQVTVEALDGGRFKDCSPLYTNNFKIKLDIQTAVDYATVTTQPNHLPEVLP